VVDVSLDGARSDVELGGDLAIRSTGGNEFEDLELSIAKRFEEGPHRRHR